MGFNLGAFAGGTADGMQAGSKLANDSMARTLTQQQIQDYQNAQVAQSAFANMLMPGMTPMPTMTQPGGAGLPAMAQMPILGPISRGIDAIGDFFSGGPAPGSKPPVGDQQPFGNPAPQPQASAPAGGMPQPAPSAPGGQPAGLPPQVQAIATAIDRANPGLRASNPRAFAQAVMLGIKQVQDFAGQELERAKAGADIKSKEADVPLKEAQGNMYKQHGELYRARADNPTPGKTQDDVVRRQIGDQIKANEVQLRHYDNLIAKELNGFMPNSAATKARVMEYKKYVDAYRSQNDILKKQLPPINSGKTVTQTVQGVEVGPAGGGGELPPAKQTQLEPFVSHVLSIGNDPVTLSKFVKGLQAEGVPSNEIAYMLKSANARSNGQPQPQAPANPRSGVVIPMAR